MWGKDRLHQLVEHRLEIVDEDLRLQLTTLDLTELVLPFARECSALQEVVVDELDELSARLGSVDLAALLLDDVAALEERLDDVGSCRGAPDTILLHCLTELFLLDELTRGLHST